MTGRMVRAVLILPGTALVVVPALLLWAAAGTAAASAPPGPGEARFWAGLGSLGLGVFLGAWSAALFVRLGRGTPAPWDPPPKLVVAGPYRHVRNPMISGVLFALLGEALLAGSWPLAGWWLFFFAANGLYFPLVEEKGLERRFGDDYRAYKANVPRWLPRPTPWRGPGGGEPGPG
ncbi:MAG: methyltransferase family protein [Rhodospirillales bacterium]